MFCISRVIWHPCCCNEHRTRCEGMCLGTQTPITENGVRYMIYERAQNRAIVAASAVGAICLLLATGCTTKKYVRSQTAPIIEHTNELDDATAKNSRDIRDVDQRAQSGVQQAEQSANHASQQAQTASSAAGQAQQAAQEAVNRADSLASVVA